MRQFKAHDYADVYVDLGVNLNTLGCVMLGVEPIDLSFIDSTALYYTNNLERFWINGRVADKKAHITLRYGLLPGVKQRHAETVLQGWQPKPLDLRNSFIEVFPSPYADEDYGCVVLRPDIDKNDFLLEANERLSLLPNVNTFTGYKPHITIAYVKKPYVDEVVGEVSDVLTYSALPTGPVTYSLDK